MKTEKMLAILVLALGLMVCPAKTSQAAPMGTAFTYQGRLMDGSEPANGLYDLEFGLYGSPDGTDIFDLIAAENLQVVDGLFTVELDFGSDVFNGDVRWLEIAVRPGELEGADPYTMLSPRQEITPAPYALQTRGIFVNDAGNVGIGTTDPGTKLEVMGSSTARIIKGTNTGSGMGVEGIAEGEYGSGIYGLGRGSSGKGVWGYARGTSGRGVWGHASAFSGTNYGVYGTTNSSAGYAGYFEGRGYFSSNVGIGTTSPGAKLEVNGDLKVSGAGKGVIFPDGTKQTTAVPSFPRPAYDSGWRSIAQDSAITLYHNIGGNVDNYVVDLEFWGQEGGRHNVNYGGTALLVGGVNKISGAYWYGLSDERIKVFRGNYDTLVDKVRVRIWVYN